ncbi:MAG: L-fucokinase [Ruminococcus sp.]
MISQLELKDVTVPSMVLHGVELKRENGEKRYIVRGYGIKDNPKKTLEERGSFLAGDLQSFINLNNLKTEDIWESEDHSLWKAKLYPVTDSQEKAVSWALLLHRMSSEKADEVKVSEWKSLKRLFSGRIFPDSRCFCIGSMGRKTGKPNPYRAFPESVTCWRTLCRFSENIWHYRIG